MRRVLVGVLVLAFVAMTALGSIAQALERKGWDTLDHNRQVYYVLGVVDGIVMTEWTDAKGFEAYNPRLKKLMDARAECLKGYSYATVRTVADDRLQEDPAMPPDMAIFVATLKLCPLLPAP
jgi:hypothetical protein